MHISLDHTALRGATRVGDLQHAQFFDCKSLDEGRVGSEPGGEHLGAQGLAITVLFEALQILEKEINATAAILDAFERLDSAIAHYCSR